MLELNFNPFPVLESERLVFRRIIASDAPALYGMRKDPLNSRFLDREPPTDIAEIEKLITIIDIGISANESIGWAISLKGQGEMIGSISYHHTKLPHHRAEIGYQLCHQYWNKGYISEAMRVIIDYGFRTLKFHSLEANVNPLNVVSIHLLEKFGFVREAYFREDYYFRGKFLDSAVYSLINQSEIKSERTTTAATT